MRVTTFLSIIIFSSLILRSPVTLASPSEDLASGIEYFTQGDYAKAKKLFIRAEKAGLDSPELIYNLGSVFYKLERYKVSKRYFERLRLDKKLGYLAHYNLGLIESKLGNEKEAIEFFEISALLTYDRRLVSLSRKQIDTIRTSNEKSWIGYLSTSYGYDSNVTFAPSTVVTSQSASLLQVLAFVDWKLSKGASDRFHITSSIFSNSFSTDQNLDDYSLSLGLEYRARVGDWKLTYRLSGKESSFAGEDYLAISEFGIDARNQLSREVEIRLQLRQEEISSLSLTNQFDFLEGDRGRFSIRIRQGSGQREFRYEYEHEINDRLDTPTDSFSPTRDQLAIQYFRYHSAKLRTGVRLDYRVSDYEPVGTQDRKDERARLTLDYSYQANATWGINGEVQYTDNQSTDSTFEYDKYTVMLGVTALF